MSLSQLIHLFATDSKLLKNALLQNKGGQQSCLISKDFKLHKVQ